MIPGRLTGNSELVRWLNQLRDAAQEATVTDVQNGRYARGAQGTQIICGGGGGGVPGATTQYEKFRIVEVHRNYLVCHAATDTFVAYNGTDPDDKSDRVNIALPWDLRQTVLSERVENRTVTYAFTSAAYDGTVWPRQATFYDGVEVQIIIPRYRALQVIYAAKVAGGISVPKDAVLDGSAACEFVDANPGGRAWCRRYNQASPAVTFV